MNRSNVVLLCALAALLVSSASAAEPAPSSPARTAVPSPGAPVDAVADAAEAEEADADAPEAPAVEQEIRAESAELDEVRKAEDRARVAEPTLPEDPASRAASRLGLDSPLRQRLRDALGREDAAGLDDGGRIPGLPEIDHDLRRLQAEYDIPIEVNEQVIAYVRFFQTPAVRKHFVKWLGRSFKYIPVFQRILREHGLPEDTVFLAMIESGFGNLATSRAKAVGPWQFIPATGKRMGLKQDFFIDERRDPEKAAHAAAKYLQELHRQTRDWRLAWAGYNAGVGKIYKARAKGQDDFWAMARGRVLKAETKGYVPKLMAAAIITKHHEAFGFTKEEVEQEKWAAYEEVTVPRATPLAAVAEAAEVPVRTLHELNPELRRTCTPPRDYAMKVPNGAGPTFARNWPTVSEATGKLAFAQHRVGRGESLRTIAVAYRVDQNAILRVNGLKPGRRLRTGTELVIPMNALARTQGLAFGTVAAEPEPERSRARKHARTVALARAGTAAAPASRNLDEAGRLRATVLVRAGDTLWSIAQRFGVDVVELCRWNGIRNPGRFKLLAGRELVVYPRRNTSAAANAASRARPG